MLVLVLVLVQVQVLVQVLVLVLVQVLVLVLVESPVLHAVQLRVQPKRDQTLHRRSHISGTHNLGKYRLPYAHICIWDIRSCSPF